MDWSQATKVEYRFGDASIAPDYHRSYTIAITDSSKVISIEDYSNILLTREYPNTPANFQAFKEQLSKQGIAKHKEKDSGACCGGTTESIRLYKENSKIFDAYVYHCDGESGNLYLPTGTTEMFHEQIPEDIQILIDSTLARH